MASVSVKQQLNVAQWRGLQFRLGSFAERLTASRTRPQPVRQLTCSYNTHDRGLCITGSRTLFASRRFLVSQKRVWLSRCCRDIRSLRNRPTTPETPRTSGAPPSESPWRWSRCGSSSRIFRSLSRRCGAEIVRLRVDGVATMTSLGPWRKPGRVAEIGDFSYREQKLGLDFEHRCRR